MKVSRTGGNVTIQVTDKARICDKCSHIFRPFHLFSDRPLEKCPMCGNLGPFRAPSKTDIAAYIERRQPKGRWAKALNVVALAAMIAAFVVSIIRHS